MPDPQQVFAAALRRQATPTPARRRVLVLGGGGPLGSSVMEALLGLHRFERVGVVVCRRVSPALRGLAVVDDGAEAWTDFAPETAVVVIDRERRANGRDDAFVRAAPQDLLVLARRLREAGARQLVVAVPHAPALLPHALKLGLASLDEAAVAALGFEHLVFMRLAQAGAAAAAGEASAPQRLAAWMLRQLHWMIPSSEQPVRAETVARVAAQLVLALPEAPVGTRVMPAELLRHVAQGGDAQDGVRRWLAGEPLPPLQVERQRW